MSDKQTRGICAWYALGGMLSMVFNVGVGAAIALTACAIALSSLCAESDHA